MQEREESLLFSGWNCAVRMSLLPSQKPEETSGNHLRPSGLRGRLSFSIRFSAKKMQAYDHDVMKTDQNAFTKCYDM